MVRVPGLRQNRREERSFRGAVSISPSQKILILLIPPHKFVARKARKFQSQNQHLALPAFELAHIFRGISHAPRTVIVTKMLPQTDSFFNVNKSIKR